MSRPNQQLTRLLQELVRSVQTGKIKLRWIVAIAVLVVGYFLLQPVLQRSLGIDLPSLGDLSTSSSPTDGGWTSQPPVGKEPTGSPTNSEVSSREIQDILASDTRRVYTSPAGLRYTGGSLQGHRLKHLMTHAQDKPNRQGQHGVFDTDDAAEIVALVDEAYLQAQTGRDARVQNEDERIVYDVNLRRRIGYIGGQSGNRKNRPAAKHMRLVVEGDRLITAFPLRP